MNNLKNYQPLTAGLFAAALLLAGAGSALAATHYVDVNSTNATPPYTDWATAATNIQDAVDAAVAGDEIVVTNGTYTTGGDVINRVFVSKPLIIRSANGAGLTAIDGGGQVRCVWLTTNATLSGFTLTQGMGRSTAGGVYCQLGTAIISNCVISANQSYNNNDNVYGGGAYGATLSNCTLSNNIARALSDQNSPVYAYGGGAYGCTLNNCTLTGNRAQVDADASLMTVYAYGGGAYACTLNNCTLSLNRAFAEYLSSIGEANLYAYGGGAASSTLNHCTLVGNSAYYYAIQSCCKQRDGNGAYACALYNCIAWDNFSGTVRAGDRWLQNYDSSCTLSYCSTWPQPSGLVVSGFGNITNAPLLVDTNGWANLRLQSNSPCINAGNNAYVTNATDLDGNPRIVGGTVDIGAYEFQAPVSQISYAWLQYYGLPINAATDTADPDGDGVDNYHEWLAGTDPTNRFSSPAQLTIIPSGVPPSGIILTWSTNAVGFTVQSTTNLGSSAAWVTNSPAPIVIGGQNVVINPASSPRQFYRLVH
jgi:hypothetical protein